jgi:hypothetical protein
MVSKSVYQEFDQTVLQHYQLDSAPKYGVLSSSNLDVLDFVICDEDANVYSNILGILKTETISDTWKNYKKAFVLPKCPVTLPRIKSVAKENNIVIVSDYTKADFIISHDEFYEEFYQSEVIKSSVMLGELTGFHLVKSTNGGINIVDNSLVPCIYDNKWIDKVRIYNCGAEYIYNCYFYSGMALDIANMLESGSLSGVVNVNTFMASALINQELTSEKVEMIKSMINSKDELEMVAKIIPTIDINKKHHLLWELLHSTSEIRYGFKKNKDIQFWLSTLRYNYYRSSAEEMILELKENDELDSESFRYFEVICRQDISIDNRELYNFKVSLKPEYLKYLNK